jgi:hypothetical protein
MERARSSGGVTARRGARANLGVGFLLRVLILACVAVIGSVWALVRFYTRERAPMVVPVEPAAAVAEDAGARPQEIEVEVK